MGRPRNTRAAGQQASASASAAAADDGSQSQHDDASTDDSRSDASSPPRVERGAAAHAGADHSDPVLRASHLMPVLAAFEAAERRLENIRTPAANDKAATNFRKRLQTQLPQLVKNAGAVAVATRTSSAPSGDASDQLAARAAAITLFTSAVTELAQPITASLDAFDKWRTFSEELRSAFTGSQESLSPGHIRTAVELVCCAAADVHVLGDTALAQDGGDDDDAQLLGLALNNRLAGRPPNAAGAAAHARLLPTAHVIRIGMDAPTLADAATAVAHAAQPAGAPLPLATLVDAIAGARWLVVPPGRAAARDVRASLDALDALHATVALSAIEHLAGDVAADTGQTGVIEAAFDDGFSWHAYAAAADRLAVELGRRRRHISVVATVANSVDTTNSTATVNAVDTTPTPRCSLHPKPRGKPHDASNCTVLKALRQGDDFIYRGRSWSATALPDRQQGGRRRGIKSTKSGAAKPDRSEDQMNDSSNASSAPPLAHSTPPHHTAPPVAASPSAEATDLPADFGDAVAQALLTMADGQTLDYTAPPPVFALALASLAAGDTAGFAAMSMLAQADAAARAAALAGDIPCDINEALDAVNADHAGAHHYLPLTIDVTTIPTMPGEHIHTIPAIIDTGANSSLISADLASRLGLSVDPSHRRLARAANGTPIAVTGTCTFPFMAGGATCAIEALVVHGLAAPLLIGTRHLFHANSSCALSLHFDRPRRQAWVRFGSSAWLPARVSTSTPRSKLRSRAPSAETHYTWAEARPASALECCLVAGATTAPADDTDANADAAAAPSPAPPSSAEALARRAQRDLARITDWSRAWYLPPDASLMQHKPDRTGAPAYKPPSGSDVDAWRTVADSVANDIAIADRPKFSALLARHRHVFGGTKGDGADIMPPVSRLPPICLPLRGDAELDDLRNQHVPLGGEEFDFLIQQRDAMKASGHLQPTRAPTLSNSFVVRQGKKLRMVCNMTRTNKATLANHNVLPRPDDVRRRLARHKYFAKFDLASSFYQIALDARSRGLTACRFGDEVLEFTVCPMGIHQAPGHLQSSLERIMVRSTAGWSVCVYIDDILIGANTVADLHNAIKHVLAVCDEWQLTLSAPKSVIGVTDIEALGMRVSHGCIRPLQERIDALADFGLPETVTQLRSFLGLYNQIGAHAHDALRRLKPLHDAASSTKAGSARLAWTDDMHAAFAHAKSALADIAPLVPFDPTRTLILLTDASDTGISAILAHLSADGSHFDIVDATSRSLTDTERNYPVHEREALAAREATKRWRFPMLGRPIIWLVDNQAVAEVVRNANNSKSIRLRNTAADMLGFNLIAVKIAGERHLAADALSRDPRFGINVGSLAHQPAVQLDEPLRVADGGTLVALALSLYDGEPYTDLLSDDADGDTATDNTCFTSLDDAASPLSADALSDRFTDEQHADPSLAQLHHAARHQRDGSVPRAIRDLRPYLDDDGRLFVKPHRMPRLVVPRSLRPRAIAAAHGLAHAGPRGTLAIALDHFYWPHMSTDCQEHARACIQCQRINAHRRRHPSNLIDREALGRPVRYRRWDIDTYHFGSHLGDFRAITAVEHYSRFATGMVVDSASAEDAFAAFQSLIVRPFGQPRTVFHDAGTEFKGAFAAGLERLGVQHDESLTDNHNGVSLVERLHRDLNNRFAHMSIANSSPIRKPDAQRWLDIALEAHNATPRPGTARSPQELLTGYQRILPLGALLDTGTIAAISEHDRSAGVDLAADHAALRSALSAMDAQRNEHRDRRRQAGQRNHDKASSGSHAVPQVGDLVLARLPASQSDGSDKTNSRLNYHGPWRVTSFDESNSRVRLQFLSPLADAHDADAAIDHSTDVHVSDIVPFRAAPRLPHLDGPAASPLAAASPLMPMAAAESSPQPITAPLTPANIHDALLRCTTRTMSAKLRAAIAKRAQEAQAKREEAEKARAQREAHAKELADAQARADAKIAELQQQLNRAIDQRAERRRQRDERRRSRPMRRIFKVDPLNRRVYGESQADGDGPPTQLVRHLDELLPQDRRLLDSFLRYNNISLDVGQSNRPPQARRGGMDAGTRFEATGSRRL